MIAAPQAQAKADQGQRDHGEDAEPPRCPDDLRPNRADPDDQPWQEDAEPATDTGYIQSVDGETLLSIGRKESIVVRLDRAIGDFVIEGTPLVSITDKAPTKELVQQVTGAYTRLRVWRRLTQAFALLGSRRRNASWDGHV